LSSSSLGHLALQVDVQQAVLETCRLHFYVVGELELALEAARSNALVQVTPRALLLRLARGDGQGVVLHLDLDLVLGEPGNRHGDAVAVLVDQFDVVRGVARLVRAQRPLHQLRQAVDTDG
jgi:hypothetical protein